MPERKTVTATFYINRTQSVILNIKKTKEEELQVKQTNNQDFKKQ